MVTNKNGHSGETPVKQGPKKVAPKPDKIKASPPYGFTGRSLTPYGGLLPVIAM